MLAIAVRLEVGRNHRIKQQLQGNARSAAIAGLDRRAKCQVRAGAVARDRDA